MSKAVIFSLTLLVMVGCSNAGRSYTDSAMVETLEVEILPNTSKMFIYRLRMPEPERRLGGGGPGMRGEKGPRGADIGRKTHERLLENTGYVVEQSGYCREGFFELDRRISPFHMWIRGECKDSATKEDRSLFSEKQTLTSTSWKK